MPPQAQPLVADITQMIQLALAPVFLLTAVSALLNVLTNRLGRIVDRRRVLEDGPGAPAPAIDLAEVRTEIRRLHYRAELVYISISLAVLCALFVCLVVAGAFTAALLETDLSEVMALLFVLAMVSLIASLLVFLREIFIAVLAVHSRSVKAG